MLADRMTTLRENLMPLTIDVKDLPPPLLEFGAPGEFTDPKVGLSRAGPFSLRFDRAHKAQVRVGLVGPADMVRQAETWFARCQGSLSSGNPNKVTYPDFSGFATTFRSSLDLELRWQVQLDPIEVEKAIAMPPIPRFEAVLNLYSWAIERLANLEVRPDVVVCCLSETIARECWSVSAPGLSASERRWARTIEKARAQGQLLLFEDWDVEEGEEDLLNRNFRRALKAKAMSYRMPIQIGRSNLFVDAETNQDPATRAWNVSLALFYKAGGIPWRLKSEGPETCFVGISFHHLRTNRRHLVYSSIAQAFSTDGDGFALRGEAVPWDPDQGRRPHLTEEQAANLAGRVLAEYGERTGREPARVVLHKTSKYEAHEHQGFLHALKQIPIVEFVNLLPTRFRLVRHGAYPPKRGTLCVVNGDANYLYTTGYIPEWGTYPGPHIPAPLRLATNSEVDMYRVAADVLGLSRMNWNTARDTSGWPITLRFARQVGGIMAEVGGDADPNPSYRYYM